MAWTAGQQNIISTLTMAELQGDIPSGSKRHCRQRWLFSAGYFGNKYLEDKGYGVHIRVHLGTVRKRGVQTTGDGGGGNVTRAEKNPGKLRRVWGFGGGLLTEASHVMVPRNQITTDKGG